MTYELRKLRKLQLFHNFTTSVKLRLKNKKKLRVYLLFRLKQIQIHDFEALFN